MSATKSKRSRKACVVCHQKKIKCDLDFKLPEEPCSNCQELNTNCKLYIRKPRIKKYQIVENMKLLLDRSNFESMNSIKVDPMNVFNRHILNNEDYKLNTLFNFGIDALRINNKNIELINAFSDNFQEKKDYQRFDLLLFNKPDMEYLSYVGCFSLPSIDLCQVYIKDFFDIVHVKFPFIDKSKFFEEHIDLKNPPSLLLIQSILCVAVNVNSKPFNESEDREKQSEIAALLYKRTKLLLDFGFEKDPFKITQALSFISLVNFNDDSCRFWPIFQSIDYYNLSPTDLSLYKKMYWYWQTKFSIHTFVGSNQLKRILTDTFINVPELKISDFEMDTHLSDLQKVSILTNFQLSKTLTHLNDLSLKADILASNNKPFDHLTRQIDYVFYKWFKNCDGRLIYKINDKFTQTGASALLTGQAYLILLNIHIRNLARHSILESFGDESRINELKYIPSPGILLISVLISYSIFSRFKFDKLMMLRSIDFESSFFVNSSNVAAVFLECDDSINGTWNYSNILKEVLNGLQNISTEFDRSTTIHDKFRRGKINSMISNLQVEKLRKKFVRSILHGEDRLKCSIEQFNFKYNDEVEIPISFKVSDIFQLNGFEGIQRKEQKQKQKQKETHEHEYRHQIGKMSITSLVSDSDVITEKHLVENFDDLIKKIETNWMPTFKTIL